eukprot:CAMPEP_0198577670 /NCGR_PEP_ID=MMETSP1462-20131121/119202_1 /TAXON_ID=1333877 /ORGANISM="Brandtodinium nutriculum, Strain RCC3387" /LENGTH=70 /DNA_ID=CAMNT_0044308953 /DNA_START=9 /DNA_END=218 /DNA_ORIENTATION=-
MIDEFQLSDSTGMFTKGGVWLRQTESEAHVTALLWGSSFDMAKHVEKVQEDTQPIFEERTTYVQMTESRE